MFVDRRMGGASRYYLSRPKGADVRLPDEVRKCVVFIGYPGLGGGMVVTGTGFLVVANGPQVGLRQTAFSYLVTARHVVLKLPPGAGFGLRVRKPNGDMEVLWSAADARWWFHPTEPEQTDVAVTHLPLDLSGLDVKFVAVPSILTDDLIAKTDIGTGDEVYVTGLFSRLQDEPIVRTGNIASVPRKPIPGWKIADTGPYDAEGYLLETRSLGGLSGSPVFVRRTLGMHGKFSRPGEPPEDLVMVGGGPFYLLGLMHGHWKIDPAKHDRVETETTQEEGSIALGLSLAVPAKKILDILNAEPARTGRENEVRELREMLGTTTTD